MKTYHNRCRAVLGGLLIAAGVMLCSTAYGQSVSGFAINRSTWDDSAPPPGDGDGLGDLVVGVWAGASTISGPPLSAFVVASGALPFPYDSSYPYTNTVPGDGSYQVVAWVDGNSDGAYNDGEPRSTASFFTISATNGILSVQGVNLVVEDPAQPTSFSISGSAINQSRWADANPAMNPPGDGDGAGDIAVGIWAGGSEILGPPLGFEVVASGAMPFPLSASYPFTVTLPTNGNFQAVAWVDADSSGSYEIGEPRSVPYTFSVAVGTGGLVTIVGVTLPVLDSTDGDNLPDWWEAFWFQGSQDPLRWTDADDPDQDGLTNFDEYRISIAGFGMDMISPANWDSDGDGMDDYWEWRYFFQALSIGLDPTDPTDTTEDPDGDGLSNWQEYCGVDGHPRMEADVVVDGVSRGRLTAYPADDLNPLDIDTDFDLLIDSFEAAWYDPNNDIDPRVGVLTNQPNISADYNLSIASGDPDGDGLTSYREMCLHQDLREGSANGHMWVWENQVPFPQTDYYADTQSKERVRVCLMSSAGTDLNLGLVMDQTIPAFTNRYNLRNHAWTDPSPGTGYNYADETIPPGWDSDGDTLPDGWEVQFGLDPRDPGGPLNWDNGPFGDPDGDGIMNWDEYVGPDGLRSATFPFINGTGDETNPNQYNHRPDSTYKWRWYPTNAPHSTLVSPRAGLGISRAETLGSALPTASLGVDSGQDSDGDGYTDLEEIYILRTSPVHSGDPFHPKAALITDADGIIIPDPEPEPGSGSMPAGVREDLVRQNWTIECYVKLLDTGLSGHLFRYQTRLGAQASLVYGLELTNNVPILWAQFATIRTNVTANALPTNQWVHLAGVWDSVNRSMSLYLDGVLQMSLNINSTDNAGKWMYPATNELAFAVSPDGSFVDNLMLDEIRIWGHARTADQINRYSRQLVPQNLADDVWVDVDAEPGRRLFTGRIAGPDFVLVNGGSLFEGQPGTVLSNVLTTFIFHPGSPGVFDERESVWIDKNENGVFDTGTDVLLWQGENPMKEGELGVPLNALREAQVLAKVLYTDKDQSGGFTRNPLLAYYRFDDGGDDAEDFVRKAKNSLTGAHSENYAFGDRGYALPTNNFSWVTGDAAPTYGATTRHADDSDGDGLPDSWEIMYGLDPYDDGTLGESSSGAKDGPNGARGDPDGDSLINLYEYWSSTNPREADTSGNGVLDAEEDLDGDGLSNLLEQEQGSRPDLVDTDDDGLTDFEEYVMGTNPADPSDPPVSRAIELGGGVSDYLEVPPSLKQRLSEWTVEGWVKPASVAGGEGVIVRRVVEQLPSGSNAVNYALGLESDGVGGLRAYVEYSTVLGQRRIVRGGAVPTGVWTHVSALYSNATLAIYTNGVLAVSSNSALFNSPKINGRGGHTFLRMGEGFAGRIDEVRIWNSGRTAGQITTNWNRTVPRSSDGLVHYFRFDDGQAVTNTLPFGPFHQPAGAQDFTYTNDWNKHWRHAAVLNGNVAFVEPDGVLGPPSLRVLLSPADAVLAGAQWSLNGGAWQNSGTTLFDLPAGIHSILYRTLSGWTAPGEEVVALSNGVATVVNRSYLRNGALSIVIQPSELQDAVRWKVDGGAARTSGEIVENLSPGGHLVEYTSPSGWIPPTSENVLIPAATTVSLVRTYSPNIGFIRVNLGPTNALVDGAQWRVNDGLWNNSGAVVAVPVGSHTIGYLKIPNWIPPATDVVTVAYSVTTTLTRVYTENPNEDSDGDGLPDWWEVLYGLDPYDATGINGADGDPDGDGLNNYYEYLSGTDPMNVDTDGDGTWDGDEDLDGDGLTNIEEQHWRTRPDLPDTDDDGLTDFEELDSSLFKPDEWHGRRITSPVFSRSPWIQRGMLLTGAPQEASPTVSEYLNQSEWLVDLWYMPTNAAVSGVLAQRVTTAGLTNFALRLQAGVPVVEFQTPTGVRQQLVGGAAIPVNAWTRLAAAWNQETKSLDLTVNQRSYQSQLLVSSCARGEGRVEIGGTGVLGYMDEIILRNPVVQDVVFVLDVSGSMAGERIESLKRTTKLALDLLPTDIPVAIVTFATEATNITQGFSLDRRQAKRLVDELKAEGSTAYRAALSELTNTVAKWSTYDRHLALFLSDGEPFPEEETPTSQDILGVSDKQITVDTIGFLLENPDELQRISTLTGGTYYEAASETGLQEAFGSILRKLYKVRYVFDDGGVTAEDVEHPLNWDFALSNVVFTTDAYVDAALTGDIETGMPEWWQSLFFGDQDVEQWGDADGDGLSNLYEYWCDTHPLKADSNGDGILDGDEDYDGDGLKNLDEQIHGSDPRLADTDDDGLDDLAEKVAGTSPANSLMPLKLQALVLGGSATDYLDTPNQSRFALKDFTIEAWVNPDAGWGGDGYVVRRNVEAGVTNYFLSVDGSLRPSAGFGEYRVTAPAAITADGATWTHLAATYDSVTQELRLYVNGTEVAVQVCGANPRRSGVGPLIQRVGEGFDGQLIEVRLWNVVRSPAAIATRMWTTLSGSEEGLAAYYRFDDGTRWRTAPSVIGTSGNNLTGGLPDPSINPWLWGQVEDYALSHVQKDWQKRWRNSATIRGSVSFTNAPGVVAPLPAVRVMLMPGAAVGAGAQWSINGGPWQNSGDTVTLSDTNNLVVNITYRTISGWTAPLFETLTISNGVTTTLTRHYAENGSLTVHLEPGEVTDSAGFSVDGSEFVPSGSSISNLSPGLHLVSYQPLDGWAHPDAEYVWIEEGEHVEIVRSYIPNYGWLQVFIEPAGARAAGAQWTVDGTNYFSSGSEVLLVTGEYTIAFSRVAEWDEPADINTFLTPLLVTNYTGTYAFVPDKDSDGDGLPDWWELFYNLDPFDPTRENGAEGDPDGDGLTNLYEYWSGTDPHDVDTSGDGTWDGDEDADGDGLTNIEEQHWGTRPDRPDTDDDGWTDYQELNIGLLKPDMWHGHRITSPTWSRSPLLFRGFLLDGGAGVQVPSGPSGDRFDLAVWTLECWIMPTNGLQTGDLIIRTTTAGQTNFALRLVNNVPRVHFSNMTGQEELVAGAFAIPSDEWTHVAGVWDAFNKSLSLYVNGVSYQSKASLLNCARGDGTTRLGSGIQGVMDEVRIWRVARTSGEIADFMNSIGGESLGEPETGTGPTPGGDGDIEVATTDLADKLLEALTEGNVVPAGVSNLTASFTGVAIAAGTYKNFPDLPGVRPYNGIILSTGNAKDAASTNTSPSKTTNLGLGGDSEMTALVSSPTFDAITLTLTFTTDASVEGLSFNVLFASDEYPEYVNSQFNDAFAAFLDGDNITFDQNGKPLTVNNNFFLLDNDPWHPGHPAKTNATPVSLFLEYDGLTPLLVTSWPLTPGTHTLKLMIADAGDSILDSAVFLSNFKFSMSGSAGTGIAPPPDIGTSPSLDPTGSKLVAHYMFDDGGDDAEDFVNPLNWDYSISGVGTRLTAASYANVFGIFDQDADGIPDWWEQMWFGSPTGADPKGDPDSDGLNNLYEYLCDTHPLNPDTDGDGVLDGDEDYDGDGLTNHDEQLHRTDPRIADTDDDGISDMEEKLLGTAGDNSLNPWEVKALLLDGGAGDYLDLPIQTRFALDNFTIESWVNPATGWGGDGYVIRRNIEPGVTNYFLSIDSSMQPRAGFGAFSVTGPSAIPSDEWTHLAVTYEHTSQELVLYVNATQVASVVCSQNPRTRGAGPLVQRIGEGFDGMLNEFRLWSITLNASNIAQKMNSILNGAEDGLVSYYRFDDGTRWSPSPVLIGTSGNNITNGAGGAVSPAIAPWQWGQVEDFALYHVQRDWMRHWRDSATIRGNAGFQALPAVRVVIGPSAALDAGAQWAIDGGPWRESGDAAVVSDTNNPTVTITYRTIEGWTAPVTETLVASNGVTTTLTRNYLKNGSLTIHLLPASLTNSTAFSVDGGTFVPSGTRVENLSPGLHSVAYLPVSGWIEPTNETVTIGENESVVLTRTYISTDGSLQVLIEPSGARDAGARWTVNGTNFFNSGAIMPLATGTYSVAFRDVAAWDRPANINVTVSPAAQTNVTGTYIFAPDKDSDGDGLPDWWELLYGLDPFDATGDNGANGDPDGDGLHNIYEYWSGTDPHNVDTNGDGVWDGDEDADGDGLTNLLEQEYGTRPDQLDTDDDGWTDYEELDVSLVKPDVWHGRRITSPVYSRAPWVQRSMRMTGVSLPTSETVAEYLNQGEWEIDLWYMPTNAAPVTGRLAQRVTTAGLTNFALRLENSVPVVEFQTPLGERHRVVGGAAIPANEWTRLAASWSPETKALELMVNDRSFQAQLLISTCARGTGTVEVGGPGVFGYMDEVTFRNPAVQDVIFVLDVSGSMFGSRIEALKATAKAALDLLPKDVPISIIKFSSEATNITQGFTLDRRRAKQLIDGLVAEGATAYRLALAELTNTVARWSDEDRHVALFLSDGEPFPEDQQPTLDDILAVKERQIVVDTIGFLLADATYLKQISDVTGGTFYNVASDKQLQEAFEKILRRLYKVRYVFDDGGVTAEDVEHPLNWAFALSNVVFATEQYVDAALTGDFETGLPTWWLDLFFGEGGAESWADADNDGLSNLYEYWSDSHPLRADTDADGVLDGDEDYDGDGLKNLDEQTHGTDPRLADTDDDGLSDLEEKLAGTAGNSSLSPLQMRVMRFGGVATDYVEMPREKRFEMSGWTLEAQVNPATGWGGSGFVLRRVVETGVTNYFLSVDSSRRPQAGFGQHRVVGPTALPTDAWTHLAVTYDNVSQELVLYVNGTAVTNTICSENPRFSGVGPLVQRIGENWNGMIEEVRLWNVVRSPTQIDTWQQNLLAGTEEGLIAYYRFDDGTRWRSAAPVIGTSGNNITNGVSAVNPAIVPWQWGQVEDFALGYVQKDWTNRWRHSASIRGNATFTNAPGAVQPQPSVRILLYPAEAVAEGGKWSLGGGLWRDSGDVVSIIGTNYTVNVTYRSVDGWTSPTNETLTLTNGQFLTLTRYYQKNGTLTYTLEPVAARTAGARWSVNGGITWQLSDVTVSNLSPGNQAVVFNTVPGWITPAPTNVVIPEGGDVYEIATYEPVIGRLYVVIQPVDAISSGALWRVNLGPWTNSGTYADLAYGGHIVEFLPLPGWRTPDAQSISITDPSVITITGVYSRITGIEVYIEPADARSAGAQWRLSGGSYYDSGTLLEVNAGTYTVEFKGLDGWTTPPTQQVAVASNSITQILGTYYQYEVVPTNIFGLFLKPRGIAFDSQRRLHVADSDNHRIVVYDTRLSVITNYGGTNASSAVGMFNQPFSVAFDSSDNLYVADGHNFRIQRRNAQTGAWTILPTNGAGIGSFNPPRDVAVDRRTNLYVADDINNRVLMFTQTSGTWKVLVTNGFNEGQTRAPVGVEVDREDRLYISDWAGTNIRGRVLLFDTNRVYVKQVGNTNTAMGALQVPYRMSVGLTNELYVVDRERDSVLRFNGSNAWDVIVGPGLLKRPEGVAWEDRGYLYIADTENNRIIRVLLQPLSTEVPPTMGGMVPGPGGMTISWLGALGWFYTLEYTDTGFDPWFAVSGCALIPGIDAIMSCTDTNNMGIPSRIYRIVYY